MKNHFDLLIFDLDGTLVDSEHDLTSSINLLRAAHNKPQLDAATVRSFIGDGVSKLIERAVPDLYMNDPKVALQSFRAIYGEHLLDTTVLYPGIKKLLQRIPQTKAVLTNKSEEFAVSILRGLDILQYFSLVVGGNSTPRCKPHPEPMLHIVNALGKETGKTLMIGDGINDVLSARAACVRSAAVGYGYTSKKELLALKPDYYFPAVKDVIKFIDDAKIRQGQTHKRSKPLKLRI